MGGYIRMDKDLEDDPRVVDLCDELAAQTGLDRGLARDAVIGGLYRLWRYADTHLGRHNRLKGASPGPARISEVTALPVSLLLKFPSEWLVFHDDGTIELQDYAAKNALIDRDSRRESGRKRTAEWRKRKRQREAHGDASPRVTNGASHRQQSVTTGSGPGYGTGTGPSGTGTGPVSAALAAGQGAAAPRSDKTFDDTYRLRFGRDPPGKATEP